MRSRWRTRLGTTGRTAAAVITAATIPYVAFGQAVGHPPLKSAEIRDIARLEMLEDLRQFDSTALVQLLASSHPEVRRRAAMAVGRIADKRGGALLQNRPLDGDTSITATVVFAAGQLKDTATVAWFDSVLFAPGVAPTVATEAAAALGKLKTATARASLARLLSIARPTPKTSAVIGEALLSIGRSTVRGDIAPIIRWSTSPDEELRWRATWALFRPRDPSAVATLLTLSADRSALVRSWAVRGLTRPQADSARLGDRAEAQLLASARDADRRVRAEALRALATYPDTAATRALVDGLTSPDSWISVSAAEGLGRIRSSGTVEALIQATKQTHSCALRVTAMQALQTFAQREALAAARAMTTDSSAYCRTIAWQAVVRDTSRSDAERRADLSASDTVRRVAALRAMGTWADTADLPMLLTLYDRVRNAANPVIASAVIAAIGGIQNRRGAGVAEFVARFPVPPTGNLRRDADRAFGAVAKAAWAPGQPALHTLDDYRAIVERWVVPAYNGAPNPTARWETPRGPIDLELYPGDAPLAVDYFVQTIQTGTVVGTEFTRVVPDFVDQQATLRNGHVLRDEVNRHRLTRANLAWATAGLDTGSPGYTLNHTPQPHNEGDFTSMGRVIRGMDAVDRIELGDRVTGARLLTGKTPAAGPLKPTGR